MVLDPPAPLAASADLTGTENYAHYERKHQLADVTRTWRGQGIQPGDLAPSGHELPMSTTVVLAGRPAPSQEQTMSERNQPQRSDDLEHPAPDHEQPVIAETGERGTVSTPGGETSVGTTPIGVGSLEPVGHHREAADRILGRTETDDDQGARDDQTGARPVASRDR